MKEEKQQYLSACFWNIGCREKNEDSIAFWQLCQGKRNRILGVVCDGIGGLAEGENASGYVVRQLAAWFVTKGYKIQKKKKLKAALQQLFFQLHEDIREYGRRKGISLGTTVSFFVMIGNRYVWGQAGDSRLYGIYRGKVTRVSVDDKEPGGALTKAIGVGDWKAPTFGKGRLRKGEALLLCSDGFYRGFKKEELEACLGRKAETPEQAERRLRQLGQRKLAKGEQDNISALYCKRLERRGYAGNLESEISNH